MAARSRIKTKVQSKKKAARNSNGHRPVQVDKVLDLLSDFLVIERGAVQLYSLARDRAQNPKLRAILEKFMRQNENHVNLLQRAVRDLGGSPGYISPSAQLQQQRVCALLELYVPARLQSISDIENLLWIEHRNYAGWSFLKSVLPFIDDSEAQAVLEKITDPIEDEEDVHLLWARETLNQLLLQILVQPKDEFYEAA